MNRKQFLILVVALVVLGGAGLALFWQDIAAYRSSGAKIGARLLPGLKVSDVAEVALQDAKSRATLVRNKDNTWGVRERGGYRANVQDISDVLIKFAELKVVQSEAVGPSLLPRLGLAAPAEPPKSPSTTPASATPADKPAADTSGTGTRVDLRDTAGKTLHTLILGKTVLKKDPGNPLPSAQNGVPAGRYVLVTGASNVAVVSDPLEHAAADPAKWLDKSFFKVDRVKTLASSSGWKIARPEEYGQWKFAGGGGDLDGSAAVGAVNALGSIGFKDVAVDSHPSENEKPVTLTADTFDNLVYTVKLLRQAGDDYLLNFSLAGEPPKTRTPEKDEKPQDKERRDKEFAETLKKLEERIAREQALSKWTYVVDAKAVAPLMKDRAELVAQKKPPTDRKK